MSSWMWFLTRSSGIVAGVLSVASIVWGLSFSARNTGTRHKPNWWLALHQYLGGLTLGFIVFHMLVSFLDSAAGLRFVDLLWPNAEVGWAIGWGVVAFWLFVVVVLPSVVRIRRHLPRRVWHLVHLLAIPALVLGGVHAYQAGTDSLMSWFTNGLALLAGAALFALLIRLLGLAQRRRAAA